MSTLMRPIYALAVAAGVIFQTQAMTSEEWYAAHTISVGDWYECHDRPAHSLTNTITVGDASVEGSTVNTKDLLKNGITSYAFPDGPVLQLTGDIWTLKLSGNTTIEGEGISATRSIVIELAPGSYTHIDPKTSNKSGNPINAYGVYAGCGLLITGPGTLSVSHMGERGAGISTGNALGSQGDFLITDGASVRIQSPYVNAIDVSYPNYGNAYNFYPHYLAVVGALLETTDGKIYSLGDVFFRKAVVNLFGRRTALEAGRLEIEESFVGAMSLTGNAIKARRQLIAENAIVYGISRDDDCVYLAYSANCDESKFGRGLYKFATLGGSGKAAINFEYPIMVDGGEIYTCAPGGYGVSSVLKALKMKSGLLRNQHSMHLKDEFFASRELMDAYGLIAGWEALEYETSFDPVETIGIFLGTTILDWFEANGIDSPEGNASAAMATASFEMSGGTIISEASDVGVILRQGYSGGNYDEPVISGGSFRGPMCYYDMWGFHHSVNTAVFEYSPIVGENAVVCVPEVVGNAYSRVTGGWKTALPQSYGTSSLYTDGEGKLYFWIPETDSGDAGGSGSSSSGGTTDTATCKVHFDANGGYGFMSYQKISKGVATRLNANSFYRPGYTFAGWAFGVNSRISYTDGQSITVRQDVTLYAQWKKTTGTGAGSGSAGNFTASGAYVPDRVRTLSGAAFSGGGAAGVLSIRVGNANKKGVFKVSGSLITIDGKRHTLKSTAAPANGGVVTIGNINVKGIGTLTLKLGENGFSGTLSNGWTAQTADTAHLPGTLNFDISPYPAEIKGAGVKTEYLPFNMPVTFDGKKFHLSKAGSVSYRKGAFVVSKGGDNNPSGLKLTYAAKTGTVKGSFKIYTFDGNKLKKWTAKVTGIVVNGIATLQVGVSRVTFDTPLRATLN